MNFEGLATQLPVVAAVIWFVLEMDRRNANYAAKRDDAWREFLRSQAESQNQALTRMSTLLERVAERLDAHDDMVRQAIARMDGERHARRKDADKAT